MSIEAHEVIDYAADPWSGDQRLTGYVYKTEGKNGTDPDYLITATPNFPPASPSRYFLYLPIEAIVLIDTGLLFDVFDIDLAVALVRTNNPPASGEFRAAPSTSQLKQVIEFNVAQAGHYVSLRISARGSVWTADRYRNQKIKSMSCQDGYVIIRDNHDTIDDFPTIEPKLLRIPVWNMDITSSVSIPHGLPSHDGIITASARIRNTLTTNSYDINYKDITGLLGGSIRWDDTNVILERVTGGFFDSVSFASPPDPSTAPVKGSRGDVCILIDKGVV